MSTKLKTQSASLSAEILQEAHTAFLEYQGNTWADSPRHEKSYSIYLKDKKLPKLDGMYFKLIYMHAKHTPIAGDCLRMGIDPNLSSQLNFHGINTSNKSNPNKTSDFNRLIRATISRFLERVNFKEGMDWFEIPIRIVFECNNLKEIFYLHLSIRTSEPMSHDPNFPKDKLFTKAIEYRAQLYREMTSDNNLLQHIVSHNAGLINSTKPDINKLLNMMGNNLSNILAEIYEDNKNLIWEEVFVKLTTNDTYGGF